MQHQINLNIVTLAWFTGVVLCLGARPAPAAPPEDTPVWRVQLRVFTADVKDAGTDDLVTASLNANNSTRMDYGGNDRERNTTKTYDLLLDGVEQLGDITMLRIQKSGSDGWCMRKIQLIVNGGVLFSQTFPSPGRWLDNSAGRSRRYEVGSAALRANASWRGYRFRLPATTVSRAEIESRIEAFVGDLMHDTSGAFLIRWSSRRVGSRWVEVSRQADDPDRQTVHVDLDLLAKIDNAPNPTVDIDFDVEVSCTDGVLELVPSNVTADFDFGLWEVFLPLGGLVEFVEEIVNVGLNDGLGRMALEFDMPAGFCPEITVTDSADVDLDFGW